MAVTDTANRLSKPGQKPFKIYDREGLFLLVNPGGSKLWRWRYRVDGKEKLMALGEYPLVSLGGARERHLAARKILANNKQGQMQSLDTSRSGNVSCLPMNRFI